MTYVNLIEHIREIYYNSIRKKALSLHIKSLYKINAQIRVAI
jgi:hypothetical protein